MNRPDLLHLLDGLLTTPPPGAARLLSGAGNRLREEERVLAARVARLARELDWLRRERERSRTQERRRREAYRRLLRGLKAIRRLNGLLLETNDPAELCGRAVRLVVEDLGAVNSSVLLLEPDRRTLRLVAAWGAEDENLTDEERRRRFNRALTLRAGEGIAGQVVATGRPRFLADAREDPDFKPFAGAVPVGSLLCFPLRGQGEILGVINVSHPRLADGGTNLRRLLYLFSGVLGHVLAVARLHRRLLKEERERQVKLATLGELTASVAHEINNPVTNVLLRAQRLRRAAGEPEEVGRLAAEIEAETCRIAKIVSQLLDLPGREPEEPSLESLQSLIEDSLILTEHHLRARKAIRVVRRYSEGLPAVRVVRRALEQVFTNLIINAAHAMEKGGTLTIVTRRATPPPERPPGLYVAVDFMDTGCGIAPEHLERVFEPFFTTRGAQGGTGLGLAISRDLVEQAGGFLTVTSRPGAGSCFTVVLPAA